MIQAEVRKGTARVEKFLAQRQPRLVKEITREMNRITVDLQAFVKEYRLSGRPGLRNITGNLRRSIVRHVEPTESAVTGIVGVAPNATKYARIHEYGGVINIPAVSGKLMVFQTKGGATVFTRKHRGFKVNMPQRSFLRVSLARNRQGFITRIERAVKRGVMQP